MITKEAILLVIEKTEGFQTLRAGTGAIKSNYIEESTSPWNSLVFVFKKKSGK